MSKVWFDKSSSSSSLTQRKKIRADKPSSSSSFTQPKFYNAQKKHSSEETLDFETERLFWKIKTFQDSMILNLIELPYFFDYLSKINKDIADENIKIKNIVNLKRYASVVGYFEEKDIPAGDLAMHQKSDIFNAIEKIKNLYMKEKDYLEKYWYDITADFSVHKKESLKNYVNFKNEVKKYIDSCDFSGDFYDEIIADIKAVITSWGKAQERLDYWKQKIKTDSGSVYFLLERKRNDEISWHQFASELGLVNTEEGKLFYDEYFAYKKVIRFYEKNHLTYQDSKEILDNIIFLHNKIETFKKIIYNKNVQCLDVIVPALLKNRIKSAEHLADMKQEACFGLKKAIDKFDVTLGNKFATCLTPWIKQALQLAKEKGNNVKIPLHIMNSYSRIAAYKNQCEELGFEPSLEDIANHLSKIEKKKFTAKKVEKIINSCKSTVSINNNPDEDTAPLENFLGVSGNVEENFDKTETLNMIEKALSKLNKDEEILIRKYYNINDSSNKEYNINELAKEAKTTSQAMDLKIKRILRKMQRILKNNYKEEIHTII